VRKLLPLLLALAVLQPALAVPAAQAATTTPYRWTVKPIDAALAKRMHTSWHAGCPVPLKDLRFMTMTFYGFDGAAHTGQMVVNTDAVNVIARVFKKLYDARFPLRHMRLVDDYQGSDDRSMAGDNTSAFNCRKVDGSSSWSLHSYGRAVDLNPVENPYVRGSRVDPPAGKGYVRRSPHRAGMVDRAVIDAFAAQGWGWGGNFRTSKDYQHFSSNGK
jgi:hypothetical protein